MWDFLRTAGTPTPPEANCTFGVGSHPCEPGNGGAPEAHGAWVAEALLDVAPSAELYIARVAGMHNFRESAQWLMDQNVDLISASLGAQFDSGVPGVAETDESVLAAVETAAANGISWVNSAGNYADKDRNYFLLLPRVASDQAGDWHNDWLKMKDGPDVFFNKAVIGEDAPIGDFRMRWGNESSSNPARLNLFVCVDDGCAVERELAVDHSSGGTVKVAEWQSEIGDETPVYLRVCRDPNGGYPSWVQIGASTHTAFETVSTKSRTINGIE